MNTTAAALLNEVQHTEAARALNALCDDLEAANNPADKTDTRALDAINSARAALNI